MGVIAMMEIVFGESACGGIRIAQGYGKGKYVGGATSVIVRHDDGTPATDAEIAEAKRRHEERERCEWESAVPLGTERGDVFGFDMALSMGDIRNVDAPGLDDVIKRYEAGEAVRVWTSDQPDERCGTVWFLAQLRRAKSGGEVYVVELPKIVCDGNTAREYMSWGEVEPGMFGRFALGQVKAERGMLAACAMQWAQLCEENAPLRAVVNGRVQSVPEDFYDAFIRREIAGQPDEFHMARAVGGVIGKYRLGIGDVWIAKRIEKMIDGGELEVVSSDKDDDVGYRKVLRKRAKF